MMGSTVENFHGSSDGQASTALILVCFGPWGENHAPLGSRAA
jgi:hypothetical protein